MADKPAMHGRDHCPTTGSDPIPLECIPIPAASGSLPWARMFSLNTDATQTIPTFAGGFTRVSFATTSIHDAASAFFTFSGSPVDRINVLAAGYVLVRWAFLGNSVGAGNHWAHYSIPVGQTNAAPVFLWEDTFVTGNTAGCWQYRIKVNHAVALNVAQDSGSNKDLFNRFIEVAYMGAYDGSASYDGSSDKFA